MNNLATGLKSMAFIAVLLFSLTACDSDDGPLEKAAENMDEAVTDMGNKVEDVCEDAKKDLNVKDTRC